MKDAATMARKLSGPVRIGVDIGGTFTDVVVVDADGRVHPIKSLSNPSDPADGVVVALRKTAEQLGCEMATLLQACGLFVHGSTIATNTLLEKKGATVGMLTTAGFRDSLEIRRCIRESAWDHRAAAPMVLVPRYLRQPVVERMSATGEELTPVDEASVVRAVELLRTEQVGSIAICLINSYANPAHEHAVRDIVRQLMPDVWIGCSADLAPVIGEYERSSTAAVNAYVAPRVLPYLRTLNERLRALGLPQDMLIVQSNGGCAAVSELADRPVQLILSGPAAGVAAIRHYARDIGNEQVIAIEVGGTSCDVTLADRAQVAMVDELEVDGYHLAVPAVEIGTIGAGGGTIAWVDGGGLLQAGPQGAGAMPGPAAYGKGGERPTVTDAQLVLGRLKPTAYAGGGLTLDRALAEQAIRTYVAEPLGISLVEAASGIIRLVEQNMRHAVERSSVERGHNPRRFALIAAGGAGPLHGSAVARSLGCRTVFVPRLAGVFCALGMCHADVRHDFQRSLMTELDQTGTLAEASAMARVLTAEGTAMLAREGFTGDRTRFETLMDLRYFGQQWTITIGIQRYDAAQIRSAFAAEHERLYGSRQDHGRIEVVNVRVAATGLNPEIVPSSSPATAERAQPVAMRDVWVDESTGTQKVPVFDGATLVSGHRIEGPAVIDDRTTTVFIGRGDALRVTAASNFLVDVGSVAELEKAA